MVPKIVLDTNVIVSAFGWRGAPHHILLRRLSFEHFVSDAVDRRDVMRNRDSGVDERREFLRDGAVFDGDRADLDDPMTMSR